MPLHAIKRGDTQRNGERHEELEFVLVADSEFRNPAAFGPFSPVRLVDVRNVLLVHRKAATVRARRGIESAVQFRVRFLFLSPESVDAISASV